MKKTRAHIEASDSMLPYAIDRGRSLATVGKKLGSAFAYVSNIL